MKILILQLLLVPCTSRLLGPNTLISTVLSNTLNIRSFSTLETKFQTHKKQQKILLLFVSLDKEEEGKKSRLEGSRNFCRSMCSSFFITVILIFLCFLFEIFEMCRTFEKFVAHPYGLILSCILFKRHEYKPSILSIFFLTDLQLTTKILLRVYST